MILAPLEQFKVSVIAPLVYDDFLDISITKTNLTFAIIFLSFALMILLLRNHNNSLLFIPSVWQILIESAYEISSKLIFDNLNLKGEKYFPYISTLFTFILLSNLVGLIPYSFTLTGQLVITFSLSFSIFIGLNFICIKKHKLNIFSLFIPANTSIGLAMLLVPIEFVSYIFKPISLGVRLFANLMAGHTLLKVIVGFSWGLILAENYFSFFFYQPMSTLALLTGLELGVAIIQAYVFTILTCIYLNDSENLH